MRTLVVGSDGFLGANLCALLRAQGHEVTGTALNRKGRTTLDALGVDCRVEYGDVTDRAFVERVVNSSEAEWVFHLAAVSIVRIAEQNTRRCLETNVLGTLNVLEACADARTVQAVVTASSDKAYGDYCGAPYTEDMPLQPGGAYETSKACADLIAQYYGRTWEPRVMVARCGNLYGPGDLNWSRLVPGSCRRALAGEAPLIHAGAWGYRREWVYVTDAAEAYIRLAREGEPGAYNVGTGDVEAAGDVATRIAALAGAPEPTEAPKSRDFGEIPEQRLDVTKIAMLGWTPCIDLGIGLTATLEWYRRYLA